MLMTEHLFRELTTLVHDHDVVGATTLAGVGQDVEAAHEGDTLVDDHDLLVHVVVADHAVRDAFRVIAYHGGVRSESEQWAPSTTRI